MEDRWFTDRRVGERFPYFTPGNAADVLADPVSPLGWTFLWEDAISPGARDGFIVFGLVDWDEFETPMIRSASDCSVATSTTRCRSCG